jgi:hypothetical protein
MRVGRNRRAGYKLPRSAGTVIAYVTLEAIPRIWETMRRQSWTRRLRIASGSGRHPEAVGTIPVAALQRAPHNARETWNKHPIAFAVLLLALCACSPGNSAGEADLRLIGNEELCGRRGNLLNGWRMNRELGRRGVDCAPFEKAALDSSFSLFSFLQGVGLGTSRAAAPPVTPAPAELDPIFQLPMEPSIPPPERDANETTTRVVANRDAGIAVVPPAAGATGAAPRGMAAPAPRMAATAPFVTPACAMRSVQPGPEADTSPTQRWTIIFRNTCNFPIRVRYAERPNDGPTGLTQLLRPGDVSTPALIESGFQQPGYVVCSYEAVAESVPCRM